MLERISGNMGARNIEELQQILIPLRGPDIAEHGAGGVGYVNDMPLTPGQLVDQPAIHCAEGKVAGLCRLAGAFHMLQQPADFRG